MMVAIDTRVEEGIRTWEDKGLTTPHNVRDDGSTLGERVKSLRQERGLDAFHLALLAGISPSALHKIETGKTTSPYGDTVAKLADALGVSPDYLISGRTDGEPGAPRLETVEELSARIIARLGGKVSPRKLALLIESALQVSPPVFDAGLRVFGVDAGEEDTEQKERRVSGDDLLRGGQVTEPGMPGKAG